VPVKEITLSAPQEDFITSACDRNLLLCGIGFGKTHISSLISADFVRNMPHVTGFIGTNTYKQLSKSTLRKIFNVWGEEFNWKRNADYVVNICPPKAWIKYGEQLERYDGTICFSNGAMILTASLDNYTTLDGTEFGWAILDETKDTEEAAAKEVVIGRLRQPGLYISESGELIGKPREGFKDWNPLYIITSPAKVDWINEWFDINDQDTIDEIHQHIFSKTDYFSRIKNGKKVVIASSYHNEHNLPKGYIENIINDNAGNQNRINMLVYASPVAKTGGEYVSGFDREKTVKKCELVPGLPIHISLDFNYRPYMSMLCFQIIKTEKGYRVQYFDEIALESPRNNTEAMCRGFAARYLEGKENPGVFYTGDASGKNHNTTSIEHNYDVVRRVLAPYISRSSDRTLMRNPGLDKSRQFINKVHAGGFPSLEIVISPVCKRLILDLEFLKEGPDGGYYKKMEKDPSGNGSYEKYGHMFDAHKYSLIASFESLYEQ
jgi:hypothetical protein